jgi:hypothetical protein
LLLLACPAAEPEPVDPEPFVIATIDAASPSKCRTWARADKRSPPTWNRRDVGVAMRPP